MHLKGSGVHCDMKERKKAGKEGFENFNIYMEGRTDTRGVLGIDGVDSQ
jgi:hypothetical protein